VKFLLPMPNDVQHPASLASLDEGKGTDSDGLPPGGGELGLRFEMRLRFAIALVAACVATAAFAQDEPKGDAAQGKTLFQVKGCYSCHGYVGQGSREGPRIAPPLAFPAFVQQLRTPRNIMPPYERALVTDQQAADIRAYLASLPKPPDPKTLKYFQE
jgi:mono/diheme cytochrome c family protein